MSLEFSTELIPMVDFKVDNTIFHMKSFDHLDGSQEVELRVLIQHEQAAQAAFNSAKSDNELRSSAMALIDIQMKLIYMMTDLTQEVGEKFRERPGLRSKLIQEIAKVVTPTDEG